MATVQNPTQPAEGAKAPALTRAVKEVQKAEVKRKTKEELIAIYAGADGVLDEQEAVMMKYDVDGDGQFSIAEVKAIINDLDNLHRHARGLRKVIIVGTLIFVLVMIVQGVMMYGVNEASKESHVGKSHAMTDTSGVLVQTAPTAFREHISDIFLMDMTAARKINDVVIQTAASEDDCAKKKGMKAHTMKVSGITYDSADSMTINVAPGTIITYNKKDGARLKVKDFFSGAIEERVVCSNAKSTRYRRRLSLDHRAKVEEEMHRRRLLLDEPLSLGSSLTLSGGSAPISFGQIALGGGAGELFAPGDGVSTLSLDDDVDLSGGLDIMAGEDDALSSTPSLLVSS